MPSEPVTRLLELQKTDLALNKIRREKDRIPAEAAKEQEDIAFQNERLKKAREQVSAMEVRRSALARETAGQEEKIIKLKGQQAQVKKNDEYVALTREIEHAEEHSQTLEEAQLNLLFEIDEEKLAVKELEQEITKMIGIHQKRVSRLEEKAKEIEAGLGDLEKSLQSLHAVVPGELLSLYETTKSRAKSPWIVPLRDQICTGCHLRVSNEVQAKATNDPLPAVCDQCGRLVYVP